MICFTVFSTKKVIPLSATIEGVNSFRFAALLSVAVASATACTSASTNRATAKPSATLTQTPAIQNDNASKPPILESKDDTRPTIMVEPMRIEVVRDAMGNEQVIARDAREVFDEGNDALAIGDYVRALEHYDELLEDFSESSLAPPALYNAGLALEALGRPSDAVARYLQLAKRENSGEEGIDARVRAAAVLAEAERWSEALATLDDMLALPTLSASNRLEGMARRGYVLLEAKDYAAAEAQLGNAITFYKGADKTRGLFENDYFAAMAYFYLGDIPRRQFDAIPIRLPETQMSRDVEAKAALVMLASERFGNTVELGNAYWGTAAGFRLAEMQREFWVSLMRAPVPPHLGEQAATLYVAEVHKQSLSLLLKALDIHRKNVKLATLYNVPTQWSEASGRRVVQLTELVGREQAGDLVGGEELGTGQGESQAAPESYLPGRIEL